MIRIGFGYDNKGKNILDNKFLQNIKNAKNAGLKVGISAYEALAGFQWFFLVNALCWYHKDNPIKRRYEKSVGKSRDV